MHWLICVCNLVGVCQFLSLSADLYFHMDYNYIVGSFTKPPTCTLLNFTEETKNVLDCLLFVISSNKLTEFFMFLSYCDTF